MDKGQRSVHIKASESVGRRFGFVRFFNVDNAVSLERDLDRCYISNRKLYVNLPSYKREGYERKGVEPKEFEGLSSGGNGHPNGQRKGKEVWREKRGKEDQMKGNVTQSYADVVNDQSVNFTMDDQQSGWSHDRRA